MLREFFGFCIPVMLANPPVHAHALRQFNEADYGLFSRITRAWEDKWIRKSEMYGGKVIGLSKDTITVQLWNRIPRTLPLAPPLLSDRAPLNGNPGMGYRLRDVKLGDVVDLDIVSVREGFFCTGIGIVRRPGGIIPPGEDPTGMPEQSGRHHFYNRMQFVEERALPTVAQFSRRSAVWLTR